MTKVTIYRSADNRVKSYLGQIFLLVDLLVFFSDLGLGGRKEINKKALKMTS